MITDPRDLPMTVLDATRMPKTEHFLNDICGHIMSQFYEFRNQRSGLEKTWISNWASYVITPESARYSRMDIMRNVGNVRADWRHNIDIGKAFEIVETVHAYLMGSLFPNSAWFDCKPVLPGYDQLARILKYYLREKLYDWKFMVEFSTYLRQLLIVGPSVMMMPWSEKERIQYECVDVFDVYFNPAEVSMDDTPIIRKIRKTRAMIVECINSGYYSNIEPLDVVRIRPQASGNMMLDGDIEYDYNAGLLKQFQGIDVPAYSMTDKVTVLEFWGDVTLPYCTIKNVIATIVGGKLVRLVENRYKCGRPFVIGTFTPVVRQPHGVSIIQPNQGTLQQINNSVNQMLDGVELAVNPMYTLRRDSTLRSEDIITEPGVVYEVDEHDALRPVEPPRNNFGLSFQEISYLEQVADKNAGTGPLIGVGQPRGGERVTAQEIQAVREAGGNRLLGNHKHVEMTSLLPMLEKTLANVQQFTKVDDVILVPDPYSGLEFFMDFGPAELKFDFKIRPRGADHVIEDQEYVRKRTEFLQLVATIPGAIERIDLDRVLMDVLMHWGFDDPELYLKQQEQPAAPAASPFQQMGGSALQEGMAQQLLADGGRGMMQRTFGVELPEGMTLPDMTNAAEAALAPAQQQQAPIQ